MITDEETPDVPIPQILVQGELICANDTEARIVRAALDRHIELTRAEPECLAFNVSPSSDRHVWQVNERFTSATGFGDHQRRVASSEWARLTAGITRRYVVKE